MRVRAAHNREHGWYTSFTLCRGCTSLPTSRVTHLPRGHESHTPLPRKRGSVILRGLYKVPLASENLLQFIGSSNAGIPCLTAIAAKSTQGPPYTDHSHTACWGPLASEGPQKHDLTMFLEYDTWTGTAGWGAWRMLRCVREWSRPSSPSQLWVGGPLSPYM